MHLAAPPYRLFDCTEISVHLPRNPHYGSASVFNLATMALSRKPYLWQWVRARARDQVNQILVGPYLQETFRQPETIRPDERRGDSFAARIFHTFVVGFVEQL